MIRVFYLSSLVRGVGLFTRVIFRGRRRRRRRRRRRSGEKCVLRAGYMFFDVSSLLFSS